MEVADAIDAESRAFTLVAAEAGDYDEGGNWTKGDTTKVELRGALFAVNLRNIWQELQDMPEGTRSEVTKVLWTRQSLSVDQTIIDGQDTYRIVRVHDRSFEGGYVKAYLGKSNC